MVEHQIRKTFNKGQSRVVSVEVVRKRRFRKANADSPEQSVSTDKLSTEQKDVAAQQQSSGPSSDTGQFRRDQELAQALQRSVVNKKTTSEAPKPATAPTDIHITDDHIDETATTVVDTDEEHYEQEIGRKRKKGHRTKQNAADSDELDLDEAKLSKKTDKHKLSYGKMRQKYNKLDMESLSEEEDLLDEFDATDTSDTESVKKTLPTIKQQSSKVRVKSVQPSKIITIGSNMRVRDLIQKLQGEKELLLNKIKQILGHSVSMNDDLDVDTAALLLSDLGYKYNLGRESRVYLEYLNVHDNPERTKTKVPVVTVVGHVDHGKTTLLDALRSTSYAEQEHGGITQSIGADLVNINNRMVTFIDTPGHELFAVMRKRGVQVTDVAVLIVAANDSVKPQTVEAIKHIKEANVPVVVAVNKCDLPNANPTKVLQDLIQYELIAESLGGDVLTVNIVANQKKGLDELMNAILLQAEIQDLKYDPERPAEVYILDCWLKKGVGNIMNGIVTAGVIRQNDVFVINDISGKVNRLYDSHGFGVDYVAAGFPVLISGCKERVSIGSKLTVVPNEYMAKRICGIRKYESQADQNKVEQETSEDMLKSLLALSKNKHVFLLKAKSVLMLHTLSDVLESFNNDKHEIKIVLQGIGSVSLSDIQTALASKADIIKFDVDIEPAAKSLAAKSDLVIHDHRIIYHLLRDIEDIIQKTEEEDFIQTRPRAQILKIFNMKNRKIAGCVLQQGDITKDQSVQIIRRGKVIGSDKILSLHRYEDSVESVKEKEEFGIQLQNFDDFTIDDYLSFN